MGIMQEKKPLAMSITTALRGAGGGGGGSARQPIESPDSLRSIAYARIVDLVGEGEIVGFADQTNPMSCVFLNETPVANSDGSLNFRNIQVDSRVGTQTQDPLPNFDGVENEIGIAVELRQDTPWTRSITNLNLDSIRVRLSTPAFSKTNTSNGDITGHYVAYRIELQTDGGTFATKLQGAFSGKTSSKYERTHRIELPTATTGWVVRVVRITANSDSSAIQDSTYIESYAEIIEAKLRMPMSALVSLIVDAEQFNNIPSRAYRLKGRIIRVPSNYDPDTREYTGVWDGTFQSRYSNNPAWVFYDMALNTRYGLGHLVPQSLVDKWTLYRIAQYCDALVDDGFGNQEPRFTCNLVLQSQGDALKVMQDLATVFRGVIYATGGSVTAVGDMPEDPVYTYTPANVVDGKFLYSGSDRKVRHTVALVSWSDLSDFGRAKVEYVEGDEDAIQRYGIQPTEIIAIGCTSRGQARRWGRYLLATERWETDSVVFSVGLDGTIVAPGKVVNIADPLRAGERRGGRIKSASTNLVEVDMMSVSAVPGDTLVVTLPNGTTERRTIESIAGTIVQVTTNFSAVPVPQSVWAVDSVDIPLDTYRILGVTEDRGERLGFVLYGIKHVNGKFAYADTGVVMDTSPVPPVGIGGAVPAPTGLTVTHRDVADMNSVAKVVNVSWDAVFVANSYNVLWRQSNGQWVDLGTTGFTNIDIMGVLPGGFEVQVMAINAAGVRSVPTFGGPYDIPAIGTPPGYVEEINNDIAQEIIDRFNADAATAAAAAADATAKANAALAAAQAYADVIGAQLNDIIEADEWSAATNYIIGDIVQWDGKLYRSETDNINQQPDTNPDDWLLMGNYTSLGEAVAASISMGTTNASDIEAVSTTLDAVVARMPVGTGELATQASVASEATARADADSAMGLRLDVVEARMPAGSGQLATASALSSLDARVVAAEGALTSQGSALTAIEARLPAGSGQLATATSVSLLDGRVTVNEGAITSQASAITSINAALSDSQTTLPSTFAQGSRYFTSVRDGDPATVVAQAGTTVNDADLGKAFEITTWTASGQNMLTRGVLQSAPGKVYRLTVRFKVVSGDGSYNFSAVVAGLNADYTLAGSVLTPSQVASGSGVQELVAVYGTSGGTAMPAGVLARAGLRLNVGEAGMVVRVGELKWEEITDDYANANAVSLLDARVTTAEGNITAQSTAITQVQASLVPSQNLIYNPTAGNGSTGWVYVGTSGSYAQIVSELFGKYGKMWRFNLPLVAFDAGLGNVSTTHPILIPSGGSRQFTFSGDIYWHANSGPTPPFIEVRWLDGSNVEIDSGNRPRVNANTLGWKRYSATATGPTGAVRAQIIARQLSTPTGTSYLGVCNLKFEAGTTATPYSDDTTVAGTATATTSLDARVTTTETGVTTLYARYTLALNVNGYVSGIRSENTGTTSTFDILADTVRILAPAGGARLEMSSSNIRVYDSGGTLRVRMGIW